MAVTLWPEEATLAEVWREAETGAARQVRAHVEYQRRPVEWIRDKLGVDERTLRWSLCDGYDAHDWDGTDDPMARILDGLADWRNVGVESATGTGKAQPVDTPVLTPAGWRPIGELRPGDFVMGSDGKPTEVLGVYPQGVRPVYRLRFSDGASTRSCAEHLWAIRTKHDKYRGNGYRVLSLEQIAGRLHEDWQIPVVEPVRFPDRDLPLDPYVLGVLLGDGGLTVGAMLSSADNFIRSEVERRTGATLVATASAHDFGVRFPERYGERRPNGTYKATNPIICALDGLGLRGCTSHTKFIPADYTVAGFEQRLDLLRGLMDTDGSYDARSKCAEFYTVSGALADGVEALVRSLGGIAKKRTKRGRYNGAEHRSIRVGVKLPEGLNPFLLPRKADAYVPAAKYRVARILRAIEPAGEEECVCIRVAAADSLYVTEDFIVTHNTYIGACIVLWFIACHEDAIVVTAAPKQDQLKLHIWKEIGRLWPRFQRHFPRAQLLDGKIRMRDAVEDRETWAATAFVCGVGADEASATKAQGFHAEHMLIVLEETPGIHRAVTTAFENTCTAPHNLRVAFGNPDHIEDELHRFCTSPGVVHIRVSALDHPNYVTGDDRIVPGAVGRAAVERRTALYAHLPALRNSRIRGISPEQAVGVALAYDQTRHRQDWSRAEIRAAIRDGRLIPFGGLDFGAWRFAFVLGGADRAGRVHVLDEYFSQDEDLTTRAQAIEDMLRGPEGYGIPTTLRLWGDCANPTDIREINQAFRRIAAKASKGARTVGEEVHPYRVLPVQAEGKARAASVDRLNDMLGRMVLLFRRGLGAGMDWRKGKGAGSEGERRTGSRLLWEIRNWRYPVPRDGEAQRQDPDDDTADGADAIAALRYAIMSWWRAAETPERPAKHDPDADTGLEELMAVLNANQAAAMGQPAHRKVQRRRGAVKRRAR